jgi:cytidylate kinase
MTIEIVEKRISRSFKKSKESKFKSESNKKSKKSRKINMFFHSCYRNQRFNKRYLTTMRMKNFNEFKKIINHERNDFKWYDMLIKIFKYDDSLYDQCFNNQKMSKNHKKIIFKLFKNKQIDEQKFQNLKEKISHFRVQIKQ